MATINQIRANRSNAKKSTGPQTSAGKAGVRFNALVHGLRAESAVIPGEDQSKFDQLLERLSAAWMPQDDMEKSLVEQIAVNQWKLARIDRSEARIHDPAVPPGEFALAIHRVYLTQVRLERSVSSTIADLDRYRKSRIERRADAAPKANETYSVGLICSTSEGVSSYTVLPKVRGLDGVWREIPREVLGDFPKPPASGDQTPPPTTPKPNGQARPGD
jgi:hypothetical protein